jgi:hypothetical protein
MNFSVLIVQINVFRVSNVIRVSIERFHETVLRAGYRADRGTRRASWKGAEPGREDPEVPESGGPDHGFGVILLQVSATKCCGELAEVAETGNAVIVIVCVTDVSAIVAVRVVLARIGIITAVITAVIDCVEVAIATNSTGECRRYAKDQQR